MSPRDLAPELGLKDRVRLFPDRNRWKPVCPTPNSLMELKCTVIPNQGVAGSSPAGVANIIKYLSKFLVPRESAGGTPAKLQKPIEGLRAKPALHAAQPFALMSEWRCRDEADHSLLGHSAHADCRYGSCPPHTVREI
jgi:hypothetical protein